MLSAVRPLVCQTQELGLGEVKRKSSQVKEHTDKAFISFLKKKGDRRVSGCFPGQKERVSFIHVEGLFAMGAQV